MNEKEWPEIEKASADLQKKIMERIESDLYAFGKRREEKNIDIEKGHFAFRGIKPSGKPPIVIRVNLDTGDMD